MAKANASPHSTEKKGKKAERQKFSAQNGTFCPCIINTIICVKWLKIPGCVHNSISFICEMDDVQKVHGAAAAAA